MNEYVLTAALLILKPADVCLGIKAKGKQKQYTGLARALLGCGPLKSFLAEASIGHFGAPLSG